MPFGIIGARIYYVIFEWSFYRQHPEEIIAIWHGGLAIHGGILAGLLVLSIYIWRARRKDPQTNLSFRGVADLLAPGLILAQAIGRWGNFFNQEAYGYETTVP